MAIKYLFNPSFRICNQKGVNIKICNLPLTILSDLFVIRLLKFSRLQIRRDGGLVGGVWGGIDAALDGRQFWEGLRVSKTELVSQNIPKVGQAGPTDCVLASAEAVDKSFGGSMTQKDIMNLNGLKSEVGGGYIDKDVWIAYRKATGHTLIPPPTGIPPTSSEVAAAMSRSERVAFTLQSYPMNHSVVVQSVIQKTYVKVTGKVVPKIIYNVMNPAQGGFFQKISDKRVVNAFFIK